MAHSTWLMFRALRHNSMESRSASMLLMELSRYASDNQMATRIWDAAQRLIESAETVQRLSAELQSGVICRKKCQSRTPTIESMGIFAPSLASEVQVVAQSVGDRS